MERLQAAMEKARKERLLESGPDDAPVRRSILPGRRTPEVSADPAATGAAWAELRPMQADPALLRRNLVVSAESSPEAAPYDILRTRIIQQAAANDWRRIAVVSPHSGSGKTTVLANLAFSFARQKDLSVLIIDFDLRQPQLMTLLGQRVSHNMADVIEGRIGFADHALRLGQNVAIGLNASPAASPAELLLSHNTSDTLAMLEAQYRPDLTIFDTTPLMSVDDSLGFIGNNTDCALLIAAADETPLKQVDMAERQVAELTNVMGIVLNKCRYANESYEYG